MSQKIIKVGKLQYQIIKTPSPILNQKGKYFYHVKRSDSKKPGLGKFFDSVADIEYHYKNLRGKLGNF